MKLISQKLKDGEEIGGQTFEYGLSDGAVGIPTENPNMDPEVYEKAIALQEKIASGELVVPYNAETYEAFNQ